MICLLARRHGMPRTLQAADRPRMYHSGNPLMLIRHASRRWSSPVTCLFLLAFAGIPGAAAAAGRDTLPQAVTGSQSIPGPKGILAAVNTARATACLPALYWDMRLETAAARPDP